MSVSVPVFSGRDIISFPDRESAKGERQDGRDGQVPELYEAE